MRFLLARTVLQPLNKVVRRVDLRNFCSASKLASDAQQLTKQLLELDWLSNERSLINDSNKLLNKYRPLYGAPEGKACINVSFKARSYLYDTSLPKKLYYAKEGARLGMALSAQVDSLLSKVMDGLGPLGNATSRKSNYEEEVKQTIEVYEQFIEKLPEEVKQKAINNLSQRIIQLRQTVHIENFSSSEFYPVAGDHLEMEGVEKKKHS
eukprot:jgi/Galph1/2850/GphlegSOOS_G1541.1